ncbi:MAG: hypothetical protein MUF87_06840 [Anaerolineae bacterium]|jgi:hypothetical protein|nr:hypothetical protein [Anaerolineae bacterium]
MSANVEAMVKEGIRAFKANKKEEARALWEKATELDQYNEQAWLWLSAVVETDDDKRTCLENVLFINPNNANAKKGLEMLDAESTKSPAPEISLKKSPAPSPTPPISSPAPKVEAVDDDDDWLKAPSSPGSNAANPFTTTDFFEDSEPAFTLDDDDDGFGALNQSTRKPESAFDDVFDDPFGDPFGDEADNVLTSGPFSAAALDDDDDLFKKPATPATPASSRPTAKPTVTSSSRPSPSPESSRVYIGDNISPTDEPDPSVYFEMIPANIKATALPGDNAQHPLMMRIGLIVLILLNIGAIGLLVTKLVG